MESMISETVSTEDYFDSISEYGALTIASRLKRVSEISSKQVAELYLKHGYEFKPTWFPIMLTLKRGDNIDIQTIATKLRLTHSAISQFVKEISKAGLIKIKLDKVDQRQKRVYLTEKGHDAMTEIVPCLRLIDESLMDILKDDANTLFTILDRLELSLKEKPFARRCFKNPIIKIVEYKDNHLTAFRQLNKVWLERYFTLEAGDEAILNNPQKHILDEGGQIFMLLDNDLPVGCIGVIERSEKQAEIIRMTIEENWRNKGYAQKLLNHAMKYIKKQGYKEVVLETNTILRAANHIYKKAGFKEINARKFQYLRANVMMKKVL